MKKLITLVLLLAVIVSCSDTKKKKLKDGNEIYKTQNDSFLAAKIDGVDFYVEDPIYFSTQNIITLTALSKNKKIRIYINYLNGPATYPFGKGISNSDNMVYTNNKVNWLASKTKGKGTITFTEKGDYLIGKFSFTGVNKENNSTIIITDGKFKVRIDS